MSNNTSNIPSLDFLSTNYNPVKATLDNIYGGSSTASAKPFDFNLGGGNSTSDATNGFSLLGLDKNTTNDIVGTLGLLKSGFDIFGAWKKYNLMQDALDFQKNAFNKQYAAQAGLTNQQLANAQSVRKSANPNDPNVQSVNDFVNQYGVKA